MPLCSIDGCGRDSLSRGMCQNHYAKWRRQNVVGGRRCGIEGCDRLHYGRGLCQSHHSARRNRTKDLGPCRVDGCGRRQYARECCHLHYKRLLKHGTTDPQPKRRRIADPVTRFWPKVDKNGPIPERRPELGPCWLWIGSGGRYGQFSNPGNGQKVTGAHRFSYELANGPIPEGLVIDHLCCVTRCVNPDHLEPVTGAENVRRGERAKLTAPQAAAIRNNRMSAAALAELHGVSVGAIRAVKAGDRWGSGTDPRLRSI